MRTSFGLNFFAGGAPNGVAPISSPSIGIGSFRFMNVVIPSIYGNFLLEDRAREARHTREKAEGGGFFGASWKRSTRKRLNRIRNPPLPRFRSQPRTARIDLQILLKLLIEVFGIRNDSHLSACNVASRLRGSCCLRFRIRSDF